MCLKLNLHNGCDNRVVSITKKLQIGIQLFAQFCLQKMRNE